MLQIFSQKKHLLVFLALAAFTLFIRFPFFFPDVIDSDESTFILFGQDILDGNLPYEKLWDVKPPFLFLSFAAFISFLGKTIPAIRLGGALCTLLAGYFVYLSGERMRSARVGCIAAFFLIVFSTISISGGGTTSETIAIVPLTAALLLFLKSEFRRRDFFLLGLLLSISCMIRLNLVYVALLEGFFLLLPKCLRSQVGAAGRISAYAAGGVIPVALCFLPYLLSGESQLFLDTMVFAPLNYAGSQLSLLGAIYKHIERFADIRYLLQNSLVLLSFLGGLIYIVLRWKGLAGQARTSVSILIVFILATGVSILKSGEAYEHYLIQMLPFASLTAALFLDYLLNTRKRLIFLLAAVFLLIAPAQKIFSAYKPVLSRALADQPLTYGPAYEIAGYLKGVNPDNKPVYFMDAHIVQWFNNTKPMSKAVTHPQNIGKEYLLKVVSGPSATVESELAGVLAKEPAFIVKPMRVRYLRGHADALELLTETLFSDYELIHTVDEFEIYKRTQSRIASDRPNRLYR